jgi:hypothetical protein
MNETMSKEPTAFHLLTNKNDPHFAGIPARHDARVVGHEPWVALDLVD